MDAPAHDNDKPPIVIGADPGFDGALVALDLTGQPVDRIPMPKFKVPGGNELDTRAIAAWLAGLRTRYRLALVALEKVHAMPKDSTPSAFKFGFYYGKLEAVLELTEAPFERVLPDRWQGAVLSGVRDKGKQAAIQYVRRRFPTLSLLATPKCSADHSGLADAACIAEWARRQIVGVEAVPKPKRRRKPRAAEEV